MDPRKKRFEDSTLHLDLIFDDILINSEFTDGQTPIEKKRAKKKRIIESPADKKTKLSGLT